MIDTVTDLNPKITPRTPPPSETGTSRRRFDSRQLFLSQNEIIIDHQGEEYRLRITSNGKLILTK